MYIYTKVNPCALHAHHKDSLKPGTGATKQDMSVRLVTIVVAISVSMSVSMSVTLMVDRSMHSNRACLQSSSRAVSSVDYVS